MIHSQSGRETDDFETVPQYDNGSDTEMWDADGENLVNEHMAHVESLCFSSFLLACELSE